jgi:hypothetical protein
VYWLAKGGVKRVANVVLYRRLSRVSGGVYERYGGHQGCELYSCHLRTNVVRYRSLSRVSGAK